MSWWEELDITGGIESLAESYATVKNAGGAVNAETAAQPEVSKQREPVKGRNADGSTMVQQRGYLSPQLLTPQNIVIGALLFAGLIVLVKKV